jgi:4-hydroxy-4-methyl-2-oxoglutarate aldolase
MMNESANRLTRRSILKAGAALAAGRSAAFASARPQGNDPVAELKGATATLLTDALSRLGHDLSKLVMSTEIRPVTRPGETIIGPAVTTQWELTREGWAPNAVQRFVFQPVDEAPAGSVWVVASGTNHLLSMFGDLIVLACKNKGMAGAVTDSGCRDIAAMNEVGFPVFAKGTVLYGPGHVIRPVAANVPVVCGGIRVRPGDVIAADVDGVLVIPKEALTDVARLKRELVEEENEVRRKIESGVPLATAYSY